MDFPRLFTKCNGCGMSGADCHLFGTRRFCFDCSAAYLARLSELVLGGYAETTQQAIDIAREVVRDAPIASTP